MEPLPSSLLMALGARHKCPAKAVGWRDALSAEAAGQIGLHPASPAARWAVVFR